MRFGAPLACIVLAASLTSVARAAASAPIGTSPLKRSSLSIAGALAHPAARASAASPRAATRTSAASGSETPLPVPASDIPPPGRKLSADQVLAIARALPKMKAVQVQYPGSYAGAYLKGPGRWQVSFFSKRGSKEIGQVIIADENGRVLEQWTGFQVAWTMARGYPGAFGRHVNALYIWLALCFLFVLPFVDPRRPLSLLHLDLLVLLSFSVSLAFFNHGHIYASVPLAYPPLIYLLVRMLWLLRRRPAASADGGRDALSPAERGSVSEALRPPAQLAGEPLAHGGGLSESSVAWPARRAGVLGFESPAFAGRLLPAAPAPARLGGAPGLRLLVPAGWLAFGVVFLLGFRIALNVTDSNVIDVGYAGVIGAQRIVDGKPLYGGWPKDNEHGDTYGPSTYEAYVPFEQVFGWSGTWDDLPAAHAAAIAFDLLALALIFLLGWRIRGPTLGIALAYAWVAYPFTLFALESNSNDTLVAVLVLAALLVASSPPARGVFAALAGLAKFAPLALAPVLATHGLRRLSAARRARALATFALAFVAVLALASVPALTHDSLQTIYQRTIAYQADRGSPFSLWGLYGGLKGLQTAVQIGVVALALGLAFVPRRADLIGLAAACGAILIATQLAVEHWFYLYIPWFFALVIVALLGARTKPAAEGPSAASAQQPRQPAGASGSARSSPLAVAWRSSG